MIYPHLAEKRQRAYVAGVNNDDRIDELGRDQIRIRIANDVREAKENVTGARNWTILIFLAVVAIAIKLWFF